MTETAEPRFDRFRMAYPSGAVTMAFYAGGAMLGEVQATHLLAVVEVVEASRVSVGIIPRRTGHERHKRTLEGGVSARMPRPEAPGTASPGLPSLGGNQGQRHGPGPQNAGVMVAVRR